MYSPRKARALPPTTRQGLLALYSFMWIPPRYPISSLTKIFPPRMEWATASPADPWITIVPASMVFPGACSAFPWTMQVGPDMNIPRSPPGTPWIVIVTSPFSPSAMNLWPRTFSISISFTPSATFALMILFSSV